MLKLAFVAALLGGTLVYGMDDYMCHTVVALDCSQQPYDPVCGTDRHIYSNDCELAHAHCHHRYIHQLHTGACVPVDSTHTNMTKEQLQHGALVVAGVLCSALANLDCITVPSLHEKVCCTNGVTYPNFCEYEKYRCNHATEGVKNIGECPST